MPGEYSAKGKWERAALSGDLQARRWGRVCARVVGVADVRLRQTTAAAEQARDGAVERLAQSTARARCTHCCWPAPGREACRGLPARGLPASGLPRGLLRRAWASSVCSAAQQPGGRGEQVSKTSLCSVDSLLPEPLDETQKRKRSAERVNNLPSELWPRLPASWPCPAGSQRSCPPCLALDRSAGLP